MQQRRLRLGDIVDDYCPRERRITNHAVVAMIEDEVKQTRCTTCDAEHEYKQARIPAPRRRKDSPSALPADAVAGAPRKRAALDVPDSDDAVADTAMADTVTADAVTANTVTADTAMADTAMADTAMPLDADDADMPDTPEAETALPVPDAADADALPLQAAENAASEATSENGFDAPESTEPAPVEDEGPVHRRLIRATLPRPEGQSPERKLPEFTMHQRDMNGNRAGRSHKRGPRPGQMRAQQGNGQPSRFGGPRPGPRHGSGHGSQGQGGQPRRRKRRR